MLLSLILDTLRDHCCRNMLPHDLKLCHKLSISQRSRESSGTGSNFLKSKYPTWTVVSRDILLLRLAAYAGPTSS